MALVQDLNLRKISLWQRLTFSDVTPLIDELAKRPAEVSDTLGLPYVKSALEEPTEYPDYEKALPRLRRSVFSAVPRFERRTLWKMLGIHVTDVHLSIGAALLSVQVLRTFEPNSTRWRLVEEFQSSPTVVTQLLVAGGLAAFIFFINILVTSMHAQKIEKEMLLAYRIRARLAEYIYDHVLRMSRNERVKIQTGDLVNIAQSDARNIASFYSHAMVDFPVLFLSVSVIMYTMHFILGPAAWVGVALILVQIPISLVFSWFATRMNMEHMHRSDKRISLVTEWVQGMRLVRYFGWRSHFEREINAATRREFRQGLKLKAHYSFAFALSTSWWMVVSLGIFAAVLYWKGNKEPSEIFAAIWLTTILGHQLNPLPWFVNIMTEAKVGSKRMGKLFAAKRQQEEFLAHSSDSGLVSELPTWLQTELHGTTPEKLKLSFELKGVTVRFANDERPALQNLNLVIPAGKICAVVGPVGSGKSVLMQCLLGDIVPSEGIVQLRVESVSGEFFETNLHSAHGVKILRSTQAFVPQEAFIAAATVRENVPLRYFEETAVPPEKRVYENDNEVMNALYAAQMQSDLNLLPQGLSTELGERGVNLSGGQKQRLSISRSVFSKSAVIFLDDPLSAVDKDTEALLAETLFEIRWKNDRTVIWNTHRLDFLKVAFQIVFLEDGQIKEVGTLEELTRSSSSRLAQFIASGGVHEHKQ